MTRAIAVAMLGVILLGVTSAPQRRAFVDVPRLLAHHPLHSALVQYDREIAALRATQTAPGLADPATDIERDAAALRRTVATARAHLQHAASAGAGTYRARENDAVAELLAFPPPGRDMAAYAGELTREANANLAAYQRAVSQRTQRALAARRQQLHEKELTLAFDLARKNAGRRLSLTVRLQELYLDKDEWAALQAELSALDDRRARAVAALRRADAMELAIYAEQLRRSAAAANAAMTAQIRAKAAANLALRRRVMRSASSPELSFASQLPAQAAAFRAGYRFPSDARTIAAGFATASADLSQQFTRMREADRHSQRGVAAQIAALQTERRTLRAAMIAQIVRDARRLAAARHLTYATARTPGGVDLTAAVQAACCSRSSR